MICEVRGGGSGSGRGAGTRACRDSIKEREGQQMIHSLKIPEPAGISMSKKDGDESPALRLDGWLFKRVLGYYERKT
jgi:hypothetical protein